MLREYKHIPYGKELDYTNMLSNGRAGDIGKIMRYFIAGTVNDLDTIPAWLIGDGSVAYIISKYANYCYSKGNWYISVGDNPQMPLDSSFSSSSSAMGGSYKDRFYVNSGNPDDFVQNTADGTLVTIDNVTGGEDIYLDVRAFPYTYCIVYDITQLGFYYTANAEKIITNIPWGTGVSWNLTINSDLLTTREGVIKSQSEVRPNSIVHILDPVTHNITGTFNNAVITDTHTVTNPVQWSISGAWTLMDSNCLRNGIAVSTIDWVLGINSANTYELLNPAFLGKSELDSARIIQADCSFWRMVTGNIAWI